MSKLVIIRGNSGSGKTTAAKAVQAAFPLGTVMRISQDTIRREILNVKDLMGNPTADLIHLMAEFGIGKFEVVMIEGILSKVIYQEMFESLYDLFDGQVYSYYFDVGFEETVRRHGQREKAGSFGEEQMKCWWLDKDSLDFPNETLLTEVMTPSEVVEQIMSDLQ